MLKLLTCCPKWLTRQAGYRLCGEDREMGEPGAHVALGPKLHSTGLGVGQERAKKESIKEAPMFGRWAVTFKLYAKQEGATCRLRR